MLKQWRQKLGYCSIFAAVPAMLASHVPEARSDEAKKTRSERRRTGPRLIERLKTSCSNPALLKRQSQFRLPHQKGSFGLVAALAGNDDCPGRTIPAGNYTAAAPYVDSGDTTGANNTVTSLSMLPYYQTLRCPRAGPCLLVYSYWPRSKSADREFPEHPAHTNL